MNLPTEGKTREQVNLELDTALQNDADWMGGRIWSLVYYAGDDVAEVLRDAYQKAIFTNGLGPDAFKSLKKFESEVVAMTATLLGEPEAVGNMTSGGTESILMAVKTARDRARAEREITEPEMVIPLSAHPAFDKSAQYLGVKVIHTPLNEAMRADVDAMKDAITPNTILLVGSAPNFPFGTIDDIPQIAALAAERDIPCHVDACVGGFLLPFWERLGNEVRPWDFRVPGVSSISADCHKYGYAARGASTVMYRDPTYRRYQFFAVTDWPGGLYGSPTMTGSRPGGAIAAAWACMNYLGEAGYLRLAKVIAETTRKLQDGIAATRGLTIVGEPDVSLFAVGSNDFDIYLLSEALGRRGWYPDRQQLPPSLHFMVTPAHAPIADEFVATLAEAVDEVTREGGESQGVGVYGSLVKLPDRGMVRNVILDFIDNLTREREEVK
ncbi:MAG TPA: aspartate aminotransferase family protein [Dehalococcoidia bacterium]|nr:aspartate aminotransferase family protein [Dehalococcoidia bacterium]